MCCSDAWVSCIYTTTWFSNDVTKALKSWYRFKYVFTDMYLGRSQTVSWDTFTFTVLASKHALFLLCFFNSWAAFMNLVATYLAINWLHTNSFGTNTTGPFSNCWLLSLTQWIKYLILATHLFLDSECLRMFTKPVTGFLNFLNYHSKL